MNSLNLKDEDGNPSFARNVIVLGRRYNEPDFNWVIGWYCGRWFEVINDESKPLIEVKEWKELDGCEHPFLVFTKGE